MIEAFRRLDCLAQHLGSGIAEGRERIPERIDPEPGALRASGRGLFLVDTLASRWGVRPSEEGKQVWFELDLQ